MASEFNIEYTDEDGIAGTGRLTIDHQEVNINAPEQIDPNQIRHCGTKD